MLFALAYSPEQPSIDQIASELGANGLPYSLPIHPNLVHLTIGLFVIAIAFDRCRRLQYANQIFHRPVLCRKLLDLFEVLEARR